MSGQTSVAAALSGDLLSVPLAPYDDLGAFSGRVRVSVPRMVVGETATTPLALIVHELATNSLKNGALSLTTGFGRCILFRRLCSPPAPPGYGTRLVERIITSALRGSIQYDWAEDGLVVTLKIGPDCLSACADS